MDFSERLKGMMNQGLDASREIIGKASAKAKELGELGMLALEIYQLRAQAKALTGELGAQVFASLVERQEGPLAADSPSIKELLQKLDLMKKEIAEREAEYRQKGGKESDVPPA